MSDLKLDDETTISGTHMLSERAQHVFAEPSVTVKYNQKVGAVTYHPTQNPQGFVDLGLAENKLCEDLLTQKLQALPDDSSDIQLRYYPDFQGLPSFRSALATFLGKEFTSRQPLAAENVVVSAGISSQLEGLAFSLADVGDYMMTTSPYYYRVRNDVGERAQVKVLEVPLTAKPKTRGIRAYSLDVELIEKTYLKATAEGKKVKAFVLLNPSNPIGTVCSAQELKQLLEFAKKYKLHVISDEAYALSLLDENEPFTSILALPHLDPERTHFLWGFSKDFGLSGYRCGVLYSTNKALVYSLVSINVCLNCPPLVQRRMEHFIQDSEWIHSEYLPVMRSRLRHNFTKARDLLTSWGVGVHPSTAAIFLWLDFGKYLPQKDSASEQWLFGEFMKEKVFLLPGEACYSQDAGYFRLVFSLDWTILQEGLKRIQKVLKKIQPQDGTKS